MAKRQVLLLGGIGAGKSTVADLLAARGAHVISADEIGHEVLQSPQVVHEIEGQFPELVSASGVNRRELAEIVFADEKQLRLLESITHPRIRNAIAIELASSQSELLVVETPLLVDLVEGEWQVVVVDAPDNVRLERLLVRGMDETDALARMRAQPTREEYLARADIVIRNMTSIEDLERDVESLLLTCGIEVGE